jgi:hypothetical protein
MARLGAHKKGDAMSVNKVGFITFLAAAVITLSGCGLTSAGPDSNQPDEGLQTLAYTEGYEGNMGLSAAMLGNFDSPEAYCDGVLLLHPDYSASEQADYIEGCLDIISFELGTSSSEDSAQETGGEAEEEPSLTVSQMNAIESAQSYLDYAAFSRKGLIEQLEFEDYSTADATFAVDYVDPDWNEQAAKSAADYLDYSSFSRQGLIDQLVYEGYTQKQAAYGVSQAGL